MDEREHQADHDELWQALRRIVRELHGVEASADPEKRSGGLIEDVKAIRDQVENGGIKRRYGRTDAVVAASLIGASSAVIVAVVRSILG